MAVGVSCAVLRRGVVRSGGQGVLCSGMASCGEIWSGGSGSFRFGRVECGQAVVVRSDVARSDVARPVWAV